MGELTATTLNIIQQEISVSGSKYATEDEFAVRGLPGFINPDLPMLQSY
jgi:hypothetical protein